MADTRTITIHMDAVQQTEMREATARDQWQNAVGYLSTWNMTFPKVDIYPDGQTDMTAVYSDENGGRGYVIGAVWHDDHYGFHS